MTRKTDLEQMNSPDLPELVRVWNRCLTADLISPARLEAQVLLDPNFRAEFFLVARIAGQMAGLALGMAGEGFHFPSRPEGARAWILALAVDTPFRRQGVGAALLEALEARLGQAGKRDLWIATYPTAYLVPGVDEAAYPGGLAFFQSQGYQVTSHAIAMDASLWPPCFPPDLDERERRLAQQGVAILAYSSRWLIPFCHFLRDALPWDWEWLALRNLARIHDGAFRPGQFLLAVSGEWVIGYCQYEGAHFGPFGVAEGFQGQGIGTLLLARALQSMAQDGQHSAWVLWTGGDAARLYARFGFRESRKFAILHKEV
ncbi:MAG: GNAT family N-acetyltransferase [Anaerolineae bacterium]|nr:GNAT family N-acetyltransferase [Anaerolineae bacterium]